MNNDVKRSSGISCQVIRLPSEAELIPDRDRQEAVNEVLMTCAQIFGAEALGYAEWNLGIKLVMTRSSPNQ
jgi:hypothetical protein